MDTLEAFSVEARRFCHWVGSPREGVSGVREALERVTSLYCLALQLPQPWHAEIENEAEPIRVTQEEWKVVFDGVAAALPLSTYGEVFDPLVVPPEEPVVALVADDLADIFRDVATGLRAFDAGALFQARYEWGFQFQNHWGEHATGVTRALHAHLAQSDPSRLLRVG